MDSLTSIFRTHAAHHETPWVAFMQYSRFLLTVASTCLVLSLGCGDGGPAIAEVSGTVTLKGEPVPGLMLSFAPDSGGKTSGGMTKSGGAFRLVYNTKKAGAIVGKHTVYASLQGENAKSLNGSSRLVKLSKKVEVVSGDNQFDLKLEDFTVGK